MQLAQYLAENGISLATFARSIGAGGAATVHRYTKGRVPDPRMMRKIITETGGAVQPNDFYADAE